MQLTRVVIENFRGIGSLEMDLDPVTAVIGENNHGKTSLFDLLGLLLGRGENIEGRHFRQDDFHLPSGRTHPESIRAVLSFASDADGEDWAGAAPPPFVPAIRRDTTGTGVLRVEFVGDPTTRVIHARFLDADGQTIGGIDTSEAVESLRRLHPVLLLRFAHPSPSGPEPDRSVSPPREAVRGRRGLEAQVARVYRELSLARGPVPATELADGLLAAQELYERLRKQSPSPNTPMRRMLDHLVDDPGYSTADGQDRVRRAGSGSHTLGLLMVLGAMLNERGEELLPEGATPIIAIEEPEVHLHPVLLASTWDVIESLEAQTIVTTNSGELLTSVPIEHLRRLVRRDQQIAVHRLNRATLNPKERRRVGYHIGAKRGSVLFARCWLLVEGETEFWILRQLAQVLGYDLEAEGVRIVEFAQCGVAPLVKLANDLGIEWHLLSDGDDSGGAYGREAFESLNGNSRADRVSRLEHRDIERTFWHFGYEEVYREAARLGGRKRDKRGRPLSAGRVIDKAAKIASKPYLALSVAEATAERGPEGVPPVLAGVIRTSVRLARDAILDGTEELDG